MSNNALPIPPVPSEFQGLQPVIDTLALAVGELRNGFFVGTGTPEANVTASVGAVYRRLDGGAATSLYVKESGVNTNTGWVAK